MTEAKEKEKRERGHYKGKYMLLLILYMNILEGT